MHIVDQASEIARLVKADPSTIKIESGGVVIPPDQMDRLLALARRRTTSAKTRVAA